MFRLEQQGVILRELSVVLERLWTFRQAMRHGMPVENAAQNLDDIKTAFAHGAQRAQANINSSVPGVVQGSAVSANSRLA